MKLADLCKMIEDTFPQVSCLENPHYKQVTCFFRNDENDEGVNLLTPWYQMRVKDGEIPDADVPEIVDNLRRLINLKNQIKADLIIKEINEMKFDS